VTDFKDLTCLKAIFKNQLALKHSPLWLDIQGVSVNRAILQHCFFWYGNSRADTAIAILLPTLKRFTKMVIVLWSLSVNFEEFGIHRNCAVPSVHAIKTRVRNFEASGSTLRKKGCSVKTECTPENIAVVRDAIERLHTVLCVATLCHSGCLKPVFDRFYTTIFLL
jgi:hypothetical protein